MLFPRDPYFGTLHFGLRFEGHGRNIIFVTDPYFGNLTVLSLLFGVLGTVTRIVCLL